MVFYIVLVGVMIENEPDFEGRVLIKEFRSYYRDWIIREMLFRIRMVELYSPSKGFGIMWKVRFTD